MYSLKYQNDKTVMENMKGGFIKTVKDIFQRHPVLQSYKLSTLPVRRTPSRMNKSS